MSWGTRRRNTIITIFFLILAIPISYFLFNIYYTPANCFDGKKNSNEQGVDCGGSCELLCRELVLDPVVLWSRFFEVSPGVYNVVALIENQNPDAGIPNIQYTFNLYDKDSVVLYERKGSTYMRPKEVIPIIENTLFTNKLSAERLSFKFDNEFTFEKDTPREPIIIIKDERLSRTDTTPRIDATIQNTDIVPIEDVTVVVIVYDNKDNAIAVSSTLVESVGKNQEIPVVFTWPKPFTEEVSRIEIIPLYDTR